VKQTVYVSLALLILVGCGGDEDPIEPEVLGGELRDMTVTAGAYPDWSGDGSLILYASGNSLWTLEPAVDAVSVEYLKIDNSEFKFPRWHPDQAGGMVGFVLETEDESSEVTYQIGLYTPGDDSPTIIYSSSKELTGLDFTNDGDYLAFIKDPSSSSGVWLLPVSGGEPQSISEDQTWDRVSGLSCDRANDTVSFLLWEKQNSAWNVYNIAVTGGQAQKITNFTNMQVLVDQERSPDGLNWLVSFYDVGHGRDFARSWHNFFTMPAAGGQVDQVTRMIDYSPNNPTWSPDGKAIALNRWTEEVEGQALFVIDLE
jgi:Tol biopolymer transport system component